MSEAEYIEDEFPDEDRLESLKVKAAIAGDCHHDHRYDRGFNDGYDAGVRAASIVNVEHIAGEETPTELDPDTLSEDERVLYDIGFEAGQVAANMEAHYDRGYEDGYEIGSEESYTEGFNDGYEEGTVDKKDN